MHASSRNKVERVLQVTMPRSSERISLGEKTVFCGVFDGYGPYGDLVARRLSNSLPSILVSIWKAHVQGDPALHHAFVDDIGSNPKSEKGNLS